MSSQTQEHYPVYHAAVPYSPLSSSNTLDLHLPHPPPLQPDTSKYWIMLNDLYLFRYYSILIPNTAIFMEVPGAIR